MQRQQKITLGEMRPRPALAITDAAEKWFEENDPEGVALSTRFWNEPHRPQDRLRAMLVILAVALVWHAMGSL